MSTNSRILLRSVLIRYLLPIAAAVSLVAFVGVPYIDRILTNWFRTDVDLRAHLVMNLVQEPLGELLDDTQRERASNYLNGVAGNQRLLGIVVCDRLGDLVLQTAQAPAVAQCSPTPEAPKGELVTHTPSGQIEISSFPLTTHAGEHFTLLIVQDLSFIDRRQTTAHNYALASIVILTSLLALMGGLAVRQLLNRWIRLLVGDISQRRFDDEAETSKFSLPVLARVREVLGELEASQRLEIDFRENWTPQALQQVVREQLESPSIFVISNREPYVHSLAANGAPVVQVPASGMVTAIEPIMRACSGTWIAHGAGSADRMVVDTLDHVRVPPEDPAYTLRRVWLTADEETGYYYGFCNEGLWPLCHLAYVRPAFRDSDWRQYVHVNDKFAVALVAEALGTTPVILIQDFHFALLPKLIRERIPRATIALFWHIPWPNAETFGVCPWKQDILTHMLSADILGFHTPYHCQNFLATLDRFIECNIDRENMRVTFRGHVCQVMAYPISIEWPPHWLRQVADVAHCRTTIRQRYEIRPEVRIGIGVERWDFTKGILERFHALEALFDKYPGWLGRLTFLQVAAPSRSKLPAYQALQARTLEEVTRINGRFATGDWQPIVLVAENVQPARVFEMYRSADFCLVNSLHDGMNLVAKEFVAARDDDDGVLILSTFTGASRELVEALLVNPYDVVATADAIIAALDMPRDQRRKRMQLMRRTVSESNVYRWAGRMLMDVARIRQQHSLRKYWTAKD